jgi:hypothetical protein
VGGHDIDLVKGFVAAWAFPHPVRDPVLNTFVAKDVAARL